MRPALVACAGLDVHIHQPCFFVHGPPRLALAKALESSSFDQLFYTQHTPTLRVYFDSKILGLTFVSSSTPAPLASSNMARLIFEHDFPPVPEPVPTRQLCYEGGDLIIALTSNPDEDLVLHSNILKDNSAAFLGVTKDAWSAGAKSVGHP